MNDVPLQAERHYLAGLLEAIERCAYFLEASRARLNWPLEPNELARRCKDVDLFESLAAINERFGKLQDTLGAAMRQAALLAGERTETFLKLLVFYEKTGVLESVTDWQVCRTIRNQAAHAYDTDYAIIAEHFNMLETMIPGLYGIAGRFLAYCREELHILALHDDFSADFLAIMGRDDTAPASGT
jgi:hypothetical protein